jgi:hypothetical protein
MSVTLSHWNLSREWAMTRPTMQPGWRWRSAFLETRNRGRRLRAAPWLVICLALAACDEVPEQTQSGQVGGRVLIAPGIGLAGARVVVDQLNLYDGKAAIRKHVGETMTDALGYYPPSLEPTGSGRGGLPTGTINGLLLIDVSGGTFTDPLNGARIQLDSSIHLKAIHWLGIFEDRRDTAYVTPVHAMIEARFRTEVSRLRDTTEAANESYSHLNAHFGGLDWEKVIPADLNVAATSPTDEVRAAFVLGGLAMLAEDMRTQSNSTPQVVNLMTLTDAAVRDLSDPIPGDKDPMLDGDDENVGTPGSGLQVGDCPPSEGACIQPEGCQLGGCRPLCDVYANTYRSLAADSISKFIGPKRSPTPWNRTTLGSEDARAFTDGITRNTDTFLFGDACAETQHRLPPTILWDVAPPEGGLQGGIVTLRVHAIDDENNRLPRVFFQGHQDTDGDSSNEVATTTIDTRLATGGVDGPLTITAIAMGSAGVMSMSTRTFEIDNTAPVVTIENSGLYVDAANVWWTATPGPTLHGTVTDAHPGTVQVVIGGVVVASATVTGTQWSAELPDDALSSSNDVAIVATDAAGNTTTRVQTLRLDTTPPSLAVDPSPVFDEINSTWNFENNANGTFASQITGGAPVDLAVTGTCPTVRKYVHLLFAPNADGSHGILGSRGPLNPLAVNAFASDDGVGILPGSVQYRVLFSSGTSLVELLPWTAMVPTGTRHAAFLFANAIPQLATTNGEYHIELRATDQFGRLAMQGRCWNHIILAPPLDVVGQPSDPGRGFQRGLFSTVLSPVAGETGDFAEKFLNSNAAGGAVVRTRFRNYLALPVFVRVEVGQNVSANVTRRFRVMDSLTNVRSPTNPFRCGASHCVSDPPPASRVLYDATSTAVQAGLRFRSRLFLMAGNETAGEVGTCAGCPADDVNQIYMFVIPARTVPQGSPLPEYGFLTYLRPTLPLGSGTDVTMAPRDATRPDPDPAPYVQFSFNGIQLTGKIMGPAVGEVCVEEDQDEDGFFCFQVASRRPYRALVSVTYEFADQLDVRYSFTATQALPASRDPLPTFLERSRAILSTTEAVLP